MLNKNAFGLLNFYKKHLDSIMDTFSLDQFMDNTPLTGAYLLGYHCQRSFLYKTKEEKKSEIEE